MQNEIGIVNINLKRGNNKAYTLSFFNVDQTDTFFTEAAKT